MNDSPDRDLEVFSEAIELPHGERAAYLVGACGGDAELRLRVEALLETHDHIGDFLEQSPGKAAIDARSAGPAGEKAGDKQLTKNKSHRVTPFCLAQRYPSSGNSYFWRTGQPRHIWPVSPRRVLGSLVGRLSGRPLSVLRARGYSKSNLLHNCHFTDGRVAPKLSASSA